MVVWIGGRASTRHTKAYILWLAETKFERLQAHVRARKQPHFPNAREQQWRLARAATCSYHPRMLRPLQARAR